MNIYKPIILIVTLVIILAGFLGWSWIKSTPQYSLYQMYKSVQAHDYDKFTRYVDVDGVVNNVVDKAMETAKNQAKQELSNNPFAALGQSLAESFITTLKPALANKLKTEIRKEIETGTFKSDFNPGGLYKALTRIKVKQAGKVSDVAISNDKGKLLTMKMRDKGGYWQIFDLEFDLGSIDATPQNIPNTTDVKYGSRADIGSGWFITVSEPAVYTSTNTVVAPKEGNQFVATEVTYENTTNQSDTFNLSNIKLKDSDDHSYSYTYQWKEPKLDSGTLEAKGKVKGFVTFEIPLNTQVKSVIYSNSDKTIIFGK